MCILVLAGLVRHLCSWLCTCAWKWALATWELALAAWDCLAQAQAAFRKWTVGFCSDIEVLNWSVTNRPGDFCSDLQKSIERPNSWLLFKTDIAAGVHKNIRVYLVLYDISWTFWRLEDKMGCKAFFDTQMLGTVVWYRGLGLGSFAKNGKTDQEFSQCCTKALISCRDIHPCLVVKCTHLVLASTRHLDYLFLVQGKNSGLDSTRISRQE